MLGLGIARVGFNSRRGAALDLNFLSGAVDGRITFSRPSTATRVNAAGLLETVASGAPRIDYDPVTLAVRGLLIEEQRSNLLTSSADLTQAAWAKSNVSIGSAITAPDGSASGRKVVESAANVEHLVQQAITAAAGTTYTHSVPLKSGERTFALMGFSGGGIGDSYVGVNLLTGAAVYTLGSPEAYFVKPAGGGWWRASLTKTATSASAFGSRFGPSVDGTNLVYAGDGTSGIHGWGSQLEVGAFATSYIPTVGAQATRAADVATMPLGSWFNATEGTLVVEYEFGGTGAGGLTRIVQLDDGSESNRIALGDTGTQARAVVTSGATSQADIFAANASTIRRAALAWRANDFQVASGGALGDADAAGSVPSMTTLRIGSLSSGVTGAVRVRRIRYYRSRLANAQLQGLTA